MSFATTDSLWLDQPDSDGFWFYHSCDSVMNPDGKLRVYLVISTASEGRVATNPMDISGHGMYRFTDEFIGKWKDKYNNVIGKALNQYISGNYAGSLSKLTGDVELHGEMVK